MNAKIYRFPETIKSIVYKIPLYTDEEIFLTVLAVNTFGTFTHKIKAANLEECDPVIVITAIAQAATYDIFSKDAKEIYVNIIKSVEEIEIRK
jgi:hypothetical protein